MENRQNIQGKKVFLLYPHSVIRDDLLDSLIMAGFEVYTIQDEKRARMLLKKFPGSIMFINIDEKLKEKEWEAYIRSIQEDPGIKDCGLGIMSYNQDINLMQKYLMKMNVSCGYVQLKQGVQESARIILRTLEANEARCQRSCFRANCQDDISATVNYKDDSGLYMGKIIDINSKGIAAKFEKTADLPLGPVLENMQIKLRTGIVKTDMTFFGKRPDNKQINVLLFDPELSGENKLIIHRYIKQCLQKYIDELQV